MITILFRFSKFKRELFLIQNDRLAELQIFVCECLIVPVLVVTILYTGNVEDMFFFDFCFTFDPIVEMKPFSLGRKIILALLQILSISKSCMYSKMISMTLEYQANTELSDSQVRKCKYVLNVLRCQVFTTILETVANSIGFLVIMNFNVGEVASLLLVTLFAFIFALPPISVVVSNNIIHQSIIDYFKTSSSV